MVPEMSDSKLMNKTVDDDKFYFKPTKKQMLESNGASENINTHHMHGIPSQPAYNAFDTFEYHASLTFKGKRQATSCCGGFCCLLLLMFIIIVGVFEVSVYLDKDDHRIGMTTGLMQPLDHNQDGVYNSRIHLQTGKNFKLGVTFSTEYQDYPQDISNWTAVGISVFQESYTM